MAVWLDMVVVLSQEKTLLKLIGAAAYATRYVAKNIVAAGLATRCEIQVSYAIGVAEPTSQLTLIHLVLLKISDAQISRLN